MALSIDMQQVAQQAVRTLGAGHGETVLELAAERAANAALSERLNELEQTVAERDAEIGRLREADRLLQDRIRHLERPAEDDPTD